MSDTRCGNGAYLCRNAHTFIPMLQPPSKYDWANERPSHSDWNLWWAALKILTSQNLLLPFFDCLGRWTESPHTPSEWHYSPATWCLYKSLLGGYYCYALLLLCSMNKQPQCLLPPQGILHYTTPSQFLHHYHTSQQVGLRHPNGLGHNCPP